MFQEGQGQVLWLIHVLVRGRESRLCLPTRDQPQLDWLVYQIHLKAEDEAPVGAIEHLRRAWETMTRSVLRNVLQKSIAVAPSVPTRLSSSRRTVRVLRHLAITWIHPHVCITTASRELRNLVDLENLNSVRNIDLNAREETEKRNSGDDMRDAAVSARQSPVLNGWLINQGVRVVIVIIACGAVFLNNR